MPMMATCSAETRSTRGREGPPCLLPNPRLKGGRFPLGAGCIVAGASIGVYLPLEKLLAMRWEI